VGSSLLSGMSNIRCLHLQASRRMRAVLKQSPHEATADPTAHATITAA
jgi:hypothetical protein